MNATYVSESGLSKHLKCQDCRSFLTVKHVLIYCSYLGLSAARQRYHHRSAYAIEIAQVSDLRGHILICGNEISNF